ncbi:hypothetical protein B0A48_01955 [Cryoendolithus antarcticus]|uniref:Uncharacterized protein n=1 Tax=Cryoendolithus antarcticus TaxID=1507870 RepID=A0A1V8TQW6_9PEZI|nr:hypothetical protein B0A48_01955 [Cryoendolithus antarcticus]
MVSWAARPEVKQAWASLAREHRLKAFPADGDVIRIFGFLDGTLMRTAPIMLGMDKSRKLGWHGFVDSKEALLETFQDVARLKM